MLGHVELNLVRVHHPRLHLRLQLVALQRRHVLHLPLQNWWHEIHRWSLLAAQLCRRRRLLPLTLPSRQAPSIRLEHHHHLRRPLEFRRRAVNLRHRRQVQRSHEAGLGPRSLTRHVDQPSLLHHSPRLHLPGYFLRYLQNFPPSNCQLWRPFGEIRCSVVLSWRPNL